MTTEKKQQNNIFPVTTITNSKISNELVIPNGIRRNGAITKIFTLSLQKGIIYITKGKIIGIL